MEGQKPTIFTFEIDNFLEKVAMIQSPKFLSSGCEWFVSVFPKGDDIDDHLAVYLEVANPKSLRLGWKRRAIFSLVLLNQSGKEFHRMPEFSKLFCAQFSGWGKRKALPLKKLQEKGFLEKNKLIVKAEVKVVEIVDEGYVTGKEMLDVSGFQVLYSQVTKVSRLFAEYPDIAVNFRPNNQSVKATYLNLLLGLIETLNKPAQSFTETDLKNAKNELMELTEAGFKLDWLKKKIDEITLERKKAIPDGSRVRELEEQIKNLKCEMNNEKVKSAAKVLSLEQTVTDLKAERNLIKSTLQNCCLLLEKQE